MNLIKVEKLEVILGRTFRKENSSSEQIFKVEKYWIHEDFDSKTYDNDIGKWLCLCLLNASRGNFKTLSQVSFDQWSPVLNISKMLKRWGYV